VRLDVKEGSTVDEAAKLVSEQYLNFMADAHRAATNNPPLYPQAITSIGLALHESPGEPEAVQFRDECQYHLDFNEASRLFTSHDLDGALTNIEAAMLLKPTSAEGATLKSKILTAISERYKQAADEMEISKQKAIVDLTRKFDSFLDRIINNNKKQTIVDTNLVYPTVAFNVASTSAAVKEALSTAIKKLNPQWEVKSQESPSPDTTVFYLNQSVAGSNPPDQLIVLTSDLPDHAVHVRANLVTVVLAGGADKITRQASGTAALADFINRFRAELPKGAIIEP
jgi:hypothetical protein